MHKHKRILNYAIKVEDKIKWKDKKKRIITEKQREQRKNVIIKDMEKQGVKYINRKRQ